MISRETEAGPWHAVTIQGAGIRPKCWVPRSGGLDTGARKQEHVRTFCSLSHSHPHVIHVASQWELIALRYDRLSMRNDRPRKA